MEWRVPGVGKETHLWGGVSWELGRRLIYKGRVLGVGKETHLWGLEGPGSWTEVGIQPVDTRV